MAPSMPMVHMVMVACRRFMIPRQSGKVLSRCLDGEVHLKFGDDRRSVSSMFQPEHGPPPSRHAPQVRGTRREKGPWFPVGNGSMHSHGQCGPQQPWGTVSVCPGPGFSPPVTTSPQPARGRNGCNWRGNGSRHGQARRNGAMSFPFSRSGQDGVQGRISTRPA